jgi:hypothetical protein
MMNALLSMWGVHGAQPGSPADGGHPAVGGAPIEAPAIPAHKDRTVAALAEAAQVRILNSDTLGADGAMQVVSLLGQLLHDEATPSGPILLPHATLARAARLLEATAQLIRQGGKIQSELPPGSGRTLADAFAEDASSLRKIARRARHATPTVRPPDELSARPIPARLVSALTAAERALPLAPLDG